MLRSSRSMRSCRLPSRRLNTRHLPSANSLLGFDFLLPAWSNIDCRRASTKCRENQSITNTTSPKAAWKTGRAQKIQSWYTGPAKRRPNDSVAQPLDVGSRNLNATLRRLDVHSRPIDQVPEEFLGSLDPEYLNGHSDDARLLASNEGHDHVVRASTMSPRRAKYNLDKGLSDDDWQMAYRDGWRCLVGPDQKQTAIGKAQALVHRSFPQMVGRPWLYVRDIIDHLIIPVAIQEAQYQERSAVAEWVASQIEHNASAAAQHIQYFWTAFVQACAAEKQRNAETVAISIDLFTMAMYAHCRLSFRQSSGASDAPDTPHSFAGFISSFVKIVQIPSSYNGERAYDWTMSRCRFRGGRIQEKRKIWYYWATQIELVRMWARTERATLVLPLEAWRDRRNERVALRAWTLLREGLEPPAPNDGWLCLDWSSDSAAKDSADPNFVDGPSGLLEKEAESRELGEMLAVVTVQGATQPKPKIRVTQSLISNLLQTLYYFKKPEVATDVIAFLKERDRHPTTMTWRGILLGLSQSGMPSELREAINTMSQRDGLKPDAFCLSIVINSYFRSGKYSEGMQHARALLDDAAFTQNSGGSKLPTRVFNIILNAILWNDSPTAANEFLQEMDGRGVVPDVYTINLLLRYYSRPKQHDLQGIAFAMQLLEKNKLVPDVVTFTTLLDALLRAGQDDAVTRVRSMMAEYGVKPNVVTYGTMIDHLAKRSIAEGSDNALTAASQLLIEMQTDTSFDKRSPTHMRPSEITFTSLLQGYANYATAHRSSSHLREAELLLREMLDKGISDNRIARSALISANIAFNDIDRALDHFNAYRSLKRARSTSDVSNEATDKTPQSTERVPLRVWQTLLHGLVTHNHMAEAKEVLAEMRSIGMDVSSGSLAKLASRVETSQPDRG